MKKGGSVMNNIILILSLLVPGGAIILAGYILYQRIKDAKAESEDSKVIPITKKVRKRKGKTNARKD
jgi:hypothetical protein